ncbi:MAG: Ig-like domain-containing protein, partial [Gemmatimonadetes bacterium]|nr:Ig-like domain-containing protein [Gemmatimonadota bacterium]
MRTPIHAQRWTWPRRALPVLVLATLLGVAGCEKTPVPPDDIPDPPAVAMVEVTPAGAELAIGITLQLEAQAKTADGTVLNRTVSWSSTDPSVATVSSGGLVRGEAPGQATITATVEGVNGTAALTVVIPNLVVTRDTALAGDLMVDSVRIAAGTTVTLTGDLTLRAGGPVEIAGDIAGECRALAVESDAAITVTGDIDTACADLPAGEAPGITLVATGALSLEGGEMRTSGDVELTNDDTLVEDDFNAFAYHEGPMPSSGLNQDSQFACIARDYRFIPDPARATDGANGGPTGGHGADGATWRLGCRGDGLLENVQVYGQGGGDGGRGENMAAADATAQGGDGGNGGLLRGRVTGSLTIRGQGTEFESGDGGQGGPARAEPAPNPAGAQAPSAMALGGDGGIPGLLDVWALGGIQVLDAGVIARIGAGGHGGLAFARGADGASADVRNDVAQAGGNAEAYGGVGANTPDAQLRV